MSRQNQERKLGIIFLRAHIKIDKLVATLSCIDAAAVIEIIFQESLLSLEDFPVDVQSAILTYGKLGDRIQADIGYIGKDLTSLPILMDLYQVDNKEIFIETILLLDQHMIEKSAQAMKRERDKLKKK